MTRRNFPKIGSMVCITELAPNEDERAQLDAPLRVAALHCVRMDGWLRMSFAGHNWGGLGGVWCRVHQIEVSGGGVTLQHCWGPEMISRGKSVVDG